MECDTFYGSVEITKSYDLIPVKKYKYKTQPCSDTKVSNLKTKMKTTIAIAVIFGCLCGAFAQSYGYGADYGYGKGGYGGDYGYGKGSYGGDYGYGKGSYGGDYGYGKGGYGGSFGHGLGGLSGYGKGDFHGYGKGGFSGFSGYGKQSFQGYGKKGGIIDEQIAIHPMPIAAPFAAGSVGVGAPVDGGLFGGNDNAILLGLLAFAFLFNRN